MIWPWDRAIALDDTRHRLMCVRIEELKVEREYWKDKAEKLLDAALFKRGEISAPVFAKPVAQHQDPIKSMMSALSITEIDSTKPASPVTPMK